MTADASGGPQTLQDVLYERNLWEAGARALRNTLHPDDRSPDFPTLAALVAQKLVPVYERMQNGRRLGQGTRLLSFVAEGRDRARFVGMRRVFARRAGIVPGDIVYDYDAAPLLHSFIARARWPVFYDAVDEEGLEDLVDRLVIWWPKPVRNVRPADDPDLRVCEGGDG